MDYRYRVPPFDAKHRDRWLKRARVEGSCIIWEGMIVGGGTPQFKINGYTQVHARRAGAWLFAGAYLSRRVLRTKCDNKVCVKPSHIEGFGN